MSSADSSQTPTPHTEGPDLPTPTKDIVKAADDFLYRYTPGMTVFDRFRDIPAPGGARLFKRIKESYTVGRIHQSRGISWDTHLPPGPKPPRLASSGD
jgi:hypothetical protein